MGATALVLYDGIDVDAAATSAVVWTATTAAAVAGGWYALARTTRPTADRSVEDALLQLWPL